MQPDQSPLDQLADIHLPDAVSWWPLAPGWWALLAVILIALVALLLWRQRIKKNRYRTLAQQELDQLYADYQANQDAVTFLHGTSVLLRRVALTAYPGRFNASMKGQAWLDWLDSVCPHKNPNPVLQFNSECGQQLLTASYQKNPSIDASALFVVCSYWLANHRQGQKAVRRNANTSAETPHV